MLRNIGRTVLVTLSNRDIYHYGQRKLSRLWSRVRMQHLCCEKRSSRAIWLALLQPSVECVAAEDRWLVELQFDPKCPYESTDGPRR